jgi:hypothetical protein
MDCCEWWLIARPRSSQDKNSELQEEFFTFTGDERKQLQLKTGLLKLSFDNPAPAIQDRKRF